jgi:hypothetical protein
MQTRYEFTLPRGYVDDQGVVHRDGTMRLATGRDELEPLRDPTVTGPDDPRLTIVVLARVIERLGTPELVTTHEIESLFAADLAFLQDFYGAINFGTREEFDDLMAAQRELADAGLPGTSAVDLTAVTPDSTAASGAGPNTPDDDTDPDRERAVLVGARPGRAAIHELTGDGH